MIKTLVIEDEPMAAKRLVRLLEKNHSEYSVTGVLDTVRDTIKTLQEKGEELDLLFCDIHLADGKSFEIFKEVPSNIPVIFITAFDEYTLQAFDINSIHYLLKPIEEEELAKALRKFESYKKPKTDIENIISRFGTEKTKRFLLRAGQRLVPKKESEVAFFFTHNKVVHAADISEGRVFVTDFTLEQLESQLLSNSRFFRINRKHLVNKEAIAELRPFKNQRLLLSLNVPCKEELILSRGKVNAFKEWFVAH